jgi:GntR family transcriptional regulator/MocR family aminotransferase
MRIPLDRDSSTPLYRQIHWFLREQIGSGALPPKTRLPATRELAASLGVNRITVTNAYAELEAEGLVYSRTGSGTFVAPPLKIQPDREATGDWPLWQQALLSQTWLPVQRRLEQLVASISHPDLISFTGGLGDRELFPVDEIRKAVQTVLRRDGPDALDYGDRSGYPPLRATIAHVLTSQGIPTYPDQVLITSGSQQAIALVAHLLLRPGDVILVESPTYTGAIDLFRSLDVRLLGVPVDEHGMQVEQVEDALRTAHPRLIYTIPTFHNPTGVCLSGHRRRGLIALADRYNVPILEDDFVGDLRYEGRVQPALKALDPGGRVIYTSTFSKMLMPGLRVGFLVAEGPVYERLLACKRVTDLATSSLMQRALEAYITVGRYQAHLRRTCRVYRRRRDTMLAALARHMPAGTKWQTPQGGLFIWLHLCRADRCRHLPAGLSANELYPLAGQEGVAFAPGTLCFPGERGQSYLRLNFSINPPEVIEEGIQRLGRAIERLLAHRGNEVASISRQPSVVV